MDAFVPLVALIALVLCAWPFGVDTRAETDEQAPDRQRS